MLHQSNINTFTNHHHLKLSSGMVRRAPRAGGKLKRAHESENAQQLRAKRSKDTVVTGSSANNDLSASHVVKKLLGGMSMAEFERDYFEKQPLLLRMSDGQELFPENMFSRATLLDLAATNKFEHGKDLTMCQYTDGERDNYSPSGGKTKATKKNLASLLDQKYSCQFYQPQRHVDDLFRINGAFEEVFGCLAGASAYLTPPAAQALAPHHDDVDVFILQTEGRKKWQLYKPLVELAGEHSSDLSPSDIGPVWQEFTLEKGDVLYFPRGVIHQACTDATEFSTHVTISVYQHTSWANFLEIALPRIIRRAFDSDVSFRRGLPIRYLDFIGTQFPSDSSDASSFGAHIKSLVERLGRWVDHLDLQQAGDEASVDFFANRLPPSSSEEDQGTAEFVLETKAKVCFRDRSHVRLVFGEDESREPMVSLYHSTSNCRLHHMGLCSCVNGQEEEEEGSSDDHSDGGDSDDDEQGSEMGLPGQPLPNCLTFPGTLGASLLKLYSSYPVPVLVQDLIDIAEDETEVRGMVLRLWSEGLLK